MELKYKIVLLHLDGNIFLLAPFSFCGELGPYFLLIFLWIVVNGFSVKISPKGSAYLWAVVLNL